MRTFGIVAIAGFAFLVSCKNRDFNTANSDIKAAKVAPRVDLSGNVLGYIDHGGLGKRRALRMYNKKVPGTADTYNTVLVEYPPILNVLGPYGLTPKSEEDLKDQNQAQKIINFLKVKGNAVVGDLKHILGRVTVYRTTPKVGDPNGFELRQVSYDPETQTLKTDESGNHSILKIDPDHKASALLAGATISPNSKGEPAPITFPKTQFNNGMEWQLVNLAYSVAKLESTWRDDFLKGAYLSTYGNRKNKVLELSKSGSSFQANFLNAKGQGISRTEFTNPVSYDIEGKYDVKMLQPGMFVFNSKNANSPGQEHVKTKFALFIDVFNATQSLNKDVVELILVDANTSSDFLMYFEDPKNGEGQP